MKGYIDSDFMSDADDRISTSRYVLGSVCYKGSKQSFNGSWICCEYVGCVLDLMLVAKLDVLPSNAMTLYCKDNEP